MSRYIRNIIVPEIGQAGQEKLAAARVLVCGAGGLGSTVIANLASLGVGTIGIIDNDNVELSNLNRQYIHKDIGKLKTDSAAEFVTAFNPDVEVKTYPVRFTADTNPDFIAEYDFLIDCFDSFESKFLLNEIALATGKTLIHGGVAEFSGQVLVIIPGKTACLRCILPEPAAGEKTKGVVSPAATTIASLQSMEALKLILGRPVTKKLLCYDGLENALKQLTPERNLRCPKCRNI